MEQEASYVCTACGEEIVVPVDPSQGTHQQYVEDCPVCCQPITLRHTLDGSGQRAYSEALRDSDS